MWALGLEFSASGHKPTHSWHVFPVFPLGPVLATNAA